MIKFLLLLIVATTSFISAQTSFAVEPGTTDTVFNKRLMPKIKPLMTYGQVVALAGAPGVKIGESAKTKPATAQYRWNGGKNRFLPRVSPTTGWWKQSYSYPMAELS